MTAHNLFSEITSLENLFLSWKEFRRGKRKKPDVQEFAVNFEDNLFNLFGDLNSKTYRHSNYTSFYINDPKQRHIHKACVRDRIVHHALYRVLYPIFDKSFIFDSYSCRLNKGTHKAVNRLEIFTRKVSQNFRGECWGLKCDIKKFFDLVDHDILFTLIKNKVSDTALDLIWEIISSYNSGFERETTFGRARPPRQGIPIGNLTSQLFANIYLNELDYFIKHRLKIKYYLRYCDDFLILSSDQKYLANLIKTIGRFLSEELKLSLHPRKIILRKFSQGIDFLGYVVLPRTRILRTKTKNRLLANINDENLASYLGLMKHCCSYALKKKLKLFDI